jgi:hypothetical protein
MLERPTKGSGASMRVKSLLILLGVTALGAYTVGRHSGPVSNAPMAAVAQPQPLVAKPVAFTAPVSPPIANAATSSATSNPAPTIKTQPAAAHASEKPAAPEIKRKVEGALTAAAIAAIIVQASRAQYHARGKPCACPDDTMRNGRACGGQSAYSRPRGIAPLCYPSDVTAAMIESYRQRQASR